MNKEEIIKQLKAQLSLLEKDFKGTKVFYVVKDALTLLEVPSDSEEVEKLTKKLEICEMNKETWKSRFEELNR